MENKANVVMTISTGTGTNTTFNAPDGVAFSAPDGVANWHYASGRGANWNVSDNVNWNITWICQTCGQTVSSGQFHVCQGAWNQWSQPLLQRIPHRCPVCDGKGKVLFDPDNPHGRGSIVQDWPCRPCGATGVLWG